MITDNYMNAYLDRRMKSMIEEWQVSTTSDIRDLSQRYRKVRKEIEDLKTFERESQDKMDHMEQRIRALREKMK